MSPSATSREQETLELRSFVLALAAVVDAESSPKKPLARSLQRMIDRWDPARQAPVLKGLRRVAADLLDATRDLDPAHVRSIDSLFRAKSVMTLSAMRNRTWRRVPRILASGRIRNDEEYRRVLEGLSDASPSGLAGPKRDRANDLVAAYEEQKPAL